jgi:disulfide bond formation protein DsbB
MSARACIALAGLGSLALLLGALAFQFIGGLAPCPMCIWQRWPHLAAVVIAAAALAVPGRAARPLALAGAGAAAVASGLGVFHAGVEQGWWEGPASCVGLDPAGLSPEQLLDQLAGAPLVRCDEIVWEFLGLTMAGWNALLSAGLVVLWLSAALTRRSG